MGNVVNNTAFQTGTGLHSVLVTVATGPVVLEVSHDGVTFQNMENGSFSASTDQLVNLSKELFYRAQIPSGDELSIYPAEK